MVGQTLGHYRIQELLGKGGMGEVYRAEDTTLDREVALKVLPHELAESQERLDRFQREAKTLAALDHPNIVHIYTVEEAEGVHFLTMQLVQGKQLSDLIPRGGMPLQRIFDIAIPLADALAAAHAKSVIHRDLKPANIMVTDEGRVKVLDFGLAKLRQKAQIDIATELPTEPLTDEGKIVGTMPYMSPEQLEGKEIDSRSDVFSLGVVLYEMATGERPFKGDSSASLITAIMSNNPREVDSLRAELPHHLSRIIRHCLEKDPEHRFQSAKDIRNELRDLHREESLSAAAPATPEPDSTPKPVRWPLVTAALAGAAIVLAVLAVLVALWLGRSKTITEPPTEDLAEPAAAVEAQPPMIVVLPFENLGNPEDEYFADGMTEEITSRLAVVSGLRVISRTSAMQYKVNRPSLKQIGEVLGVDYVLEGSVRWAGNAEGGERVRITPQLVRVSDDTHVWAGNYDRVIDDIFATQSEIAENVVSKLGVSILDTEHQILTVGLTDNPAAYHAFLQGLETWRRQSEGDYLEVTERAAGLFEKAVELDPEFARAWAWLSFVKLFYVWNSGLAPEYVTEAKAALDRALELAPKDPHVRHARGHYYYYGLLDFDRALQEYLLVQGDLPNDADVAVSVGAIHRRQGRYEQTIDSFEHALTLDPLSVSTWRELATTYRAVLQFPKALKAIDQGIRIARDNVQLYVDKALILASIGDLEGARKVLSEAPVTVPMHHAWGRLEFLDRNFEAALEHAELMPRKGYVDRVIAVLLRADILLRLERSEEAREDLQTLASEIENLIASGSQRVHDDLGLTYARLGRREHAIREVQRQIELDAEDFLDGPLWQEKLAYVYTMFGEAEAAIEIFDHLLVTSYNAAITIEFLRLDPRLDPLRDHPRFQALLEKHK